MTRVRFAATSCAAVMLLLAAAPYAAQVADAPARQSPERTQPGGRAASPSGRGAAPADRSASPVDRSQSPVERSDDRGIENQGPIYTYVRSVVRIGQDFTLPSGETADEITLIMGNGRVEGRVDHDVVIVMGRAEVASTASIGGALVVIGGNVTVAPGAEVRGDLVAIGGAVEAAPAFRPGGESVVIGANLLGGRLDGLVPWITRGLFWGRPIVPGLAWVWGIVAIFFLLYLSVNLVFHNGVRSSADILAARPLTAFLVGLLVLLLIGPVCVLLAVSVIGIPIVPVVICGVLIAGLIGKVSVIRWIGMRVMPEEEVGNQLQSTRSFAIGFAILCVPYMIPIVGFVALAAVGVLGLGSAALAFMAGYRKENPLPPRREAPPMPPAPPNPPASFPPSDAFGSGGPLPDPTPNLSMRMESLASDGPPAGGFMSDDTGPPSAGPVNPMNPASTLALPSFSSQRLIGFPHATFVHRLAAFALDTILVLISVQLLPIVRHADGDGVFLTMLAYHIGFWTWKGTTVGGIICQLRLVRLDGTQLRFADALVRGLSGIFSLVVVGLGVLWILKDPEQQAWHDKIAGTYVVKVPRHWPI